MESSQASEQSENLTSDELARIDAGLEQLESDSNLTPRRFEELLGTVLRPLLGSEGFSMRVTVGPGDGGIDFYAVRAIPGDDGAIETLGIQAKFYRMSGRTVGSSQVRELIGAGLLSGLGRVMLVSNAKFSTQTKEDIRRSLPIAVELLDISELKSWAKRLRTPEINIETEVRVILRDVSQALIRLIAKNVTALQYLEWRDVERVVAEVFSGLGFEAVLTPGSKDGGKDVILTCTTQGVRAKYYVEVKHWRSATRVGATAVEQLLSVMVEEETQGGLFLSTYGFTDNAFEQLTVLDRERLRFGDKDKIVTLCKSWVKARSGLWSPPQNLSQILFED